MEIIAGKQVFTTPEEILDPSHTALIVVDMQNDFCAPGGLWHSLGLDLTALEAVVPNIRRLIAGARAARVPVIYIKMTNRSDLESLSPTRLRYQVLKLHQRPDQIIARIGSWGAEILPELSPEPGEQVIEKWRYSAFDGTCLDQLLRSYGIQTVVLCGTTTSVCVESAARDAFAHDYFTVLAADCVSDVRKDWHDASLLLMAARVDEWTLEQIGAVWEASALARTATVSVPTSTEPVR